MSTRDFKINVILFIVLAGARGPRVHPFFVEVVWVHIVKNIIVAVFRLLILYPLLV